MITIRFIVDGVAKEFKIDNDDRRYSTIGSLRLALSNHEQIYFNESHLRNLSVQAEDILIKIGNQEISDGISLGKAISLDVYLRPLDENDERWSTVLQWARRESLVIFLDNLSWIPQKYVDDFIQTQDFIRCFLVLFEPFTDEKKEMAIKAKFLLDYASDLALEGLILQAAGEYETPGGKAFLISPFGLACIGTIGIKRGRPYAISKSCQVYDSVFFTLIRKASPEVLGQVLGQVITATGGTIFHKAAEHSYSVFRTLLEKIKPEVVDRLINCEESENRTVLHRVIQCQNFYNFTLLLKKASFKSIQEAFDQKRDETLNFFIEKSRKEDRILFQIYYELMKTHRFLFSSRGGFHLRDKEKIMNFYELYRRLVERSEHPGRFKNGYDFVLETLEKEGLSVNYDHSGVYFSFFLGLKDSRICGVIQPYKDFLMKAAKDSDDLEEKRVADCFLRGKTPYQREMGVDRSINRFFRPPSLFKGLLEDSTVSEGNRFIENDML